jgi:hypothetical protein
LVVAKVWGDNVAKTEGWDVAKRGDVAKRVGRGCESGVEMAKRVKVAKRGGAIVGRVRG